MLFAALYDKDDFLNVLTDFTIERQKDGKEKANPKGAGKSLLRDDWMRTIRQNGVPQSKAGAWIRPNPVKQHGTGTSGAPCDADVTRFQSCLLESDDLPFDLQLSLWARLPLPIVAIIDSGGRSAAVVIVAHACRNTATMRGTSKREDAAFSIIRLDEVSGSDDQHGAKFVTRFVKNRNAPNDPASFEWNIRPDGEGVLVTYCEADNLTLFRQWIEDGLDTCGEIAEEMGLSKGQVSKLAKKAEKSGWLKKVGRKYELIA